MQAWGLNQFTHSATAVEQRFDANIASALRSTHSSFRKIKTASVKALAHLLSEDSPPAFEIVYIDGSHLPADVLTDAVLAWRLLRSGGILILDDARWHEVTGKEPSECPAAAIDAFLNVFGNQLLVLEQGYQCIVQKQDVGAL